MRWGSAHGTALTCTCCSQACPHGCRIPRPCRNAVVGMANGMQTIDVYRFVRSAREVGAAEAAMAVILAANMLSATRRQRRARRS